VVDVGVVPWLVAAVFVVVLGGSGGGVGGHG
jgi:hypothetical protein